MILRNPFRFGFLRNQIRRLTTEKTEAIETAEITITPTKAISSKPRQRKPGNTNKNRLKPGQGDPKLAQGIIDLAEGKEQFKV